MVTSILPIRQYTKVVTYQVKKNVKPKTPFSFELISYKGYLFEFVSLDVTDNIIEIESGNTVESKKIGNRILFS